VKKKLKRLHSESVKESSGRVKAYALGVFASLASFLLMACNMTTGNSVQIGQSTTEAAIEFPEAKVRALAVAAARGDGNEVKALAQAGVNVNAIGKRGRISPLMYAVMAESEAGVNALLKAGADPNYLIPKSIEFRKTNPDADTSGSALYYAVYKKNQRIVRLLLAAGGNPGLDGPIVPVMFHLGEDGNEVNPLLKMMIEEFKGNVNLKESRGRPMVVDFFELGKFANALYLINKGADLGVLFPVPIPLARYDNLPRIPSQDEGGDYGQLPPKLPDAVKPYYVMNNWLGISVQRVTGADGKSGHPLAREVRRLMEGRGIKFPQIDTEAIQIEHSKTKEITLDLFLKNFVPIEMVGLIIDSYKGSPFEPHVDQLKIEYAEYIKKNNKK
jgi:hypothetical protein